MNKLLAMTLLTFLLLPALSQAQKRIMIGNTGVSFSSPCQVSFDRSQSKDSSTVYNGECQSGELTYGIILVKLLHRRGDLNEAEKITADYMQYLNESFNIIHAEGFQKGLRLNNNEKTRGVYDQWGDAQQNKWLVNGWTNGSYIAVLYVYGKKLTEGSNALFLNSLRFPQ
jgi:hypothetical protein